MYSFTVCDASEPIPKLYYLMDMRHNTVANKIARWKFKRLKQENYVRMHNG